jgi:uncharacterized protein YbjQ (UPF0145 family)
MTLIATGNINAPYEVLGVVHAVVTRTSKSTGCGGIGGLPIQEAYEAVTNALHAAAIQSGGNGVIHVGYDYRLSTTKLGCNNTQPVFEVYGWGTAIRVAA